MKDQAFITLEYRQLAQLIKQNAQTESGRNRVETLAPLDSINDLRRSLARLNECVSLRNRGISWSFSDFPDQQETLARLRVEGLALDPVAMLQLARVCQQVLAARAYLLAEREAAPELWAVVESLPRDLNSLVARVENKILPSGEIDDRASPELGRIRQEISTLRSRITRLLENLMRRSSEAIQDELVTIRNERFVIPVKADHRGRVQGVSHGFSSSGATTFIEPLETIEANNELQHLHESEAREIGRILAALTEDFRAQLPGIEMASNAVGELDFINAKAAFHRKFSCEIPNIEIVSGPGSGSLELVDARHPLLEENLRSVGKEVVPVSFALDPEHNSMVISGANAGGKTVVLKTTGLLALMALSGVSVPARSACFPFYSSVLADIGDHQSIAANLSTFTSHTANIARMIETCEAPALVLLDEVGTGTDPEEGSALGVAVVDYFRKICGAHVVATTHYSGLKMYAANEDGVVNASVEFDERTLQPTYHLIVGVAGSSSGLEIARRFGVPASIIAKATSSVAESSLQASEYLRRIKRESEEAEALRIALEEERVAVAEKFASLETEAVKREKSRQETFQKTLERSVADFERRTRELTTRITDRADRLKVEKEALKQVSELKREAERAIRAANGKEQIEPRAVKVVRDGQVLSKSTDIVDEESPTYIAAAPRDLAVGDKVRLKSFGSIGVIDQIKGEEAEVRVKALRFREKLTNLELMEAAPQPSVHGKLEKLKRAQRTEIHLRATEQKSESELNVIGQTTDEAVDAVDKFLDEASLASLSQVRIVHGHGTGALRRAIGDLLRDHPHVARFVAAPPDQGGTGATLVELRQ